MGLRTELKEELRRKNQRIRELSAALADYECGGAMKGESMSESLMKMGAAVARKTLNEVVSDLDDLERGYGIVAPNPDTKASMEKRFRELFHKLSEVNNWLHAIEHS